jgi:hypothetical protein
LDAARKKKRRTPKKSGGFERRMYTELNCRKCGWLACLVPPEGVDDFYQAFNEALSIGASVNIISAILDRLIARAEAEK